MESNTSIIDLNLWDMMTVVTGKQIGILVLIGLVAMIGIMIVVIVVIVVIVAIVVLLHDAMACGNHTC
jgi:hypothetical protein